MKADTMTAQHAPGPWTYESDHTHRQFNIRMLGHLIGTRDEAKHICTVNNLPSHVLANRDAGTAEANARLIAAAPALLADAKALLDITGGDIFTDADECRASVEKVEQIRAQLRATITKATGA
jgi:hypothetical protein